MIWCLNSELDLNLSCAKDFRNQNSMVTLCINWRDCWFNNFSAQSIKMISHYKKIGYSINVFQQTACMVVNQITVGNFAFLFNCTSVGRPLDSMTVPTERLIYWWDDGGGVWCIDCCRAHRYLPVGFLLLRNSVLFTVESLSLLYLLFSILAHSSNAKCFRNVTLIDVRGLAEIILPVRGYGRHSPNQVMIKRE